MPSPNEKLAESLDVLEALQQGNRRVFRSDDLSRVHRERLVENGFLQEVMKGWLISSSPDAQAGESTPWHASFWEFCARYCDERFGEQWHLSPEQSLFLHGERTVIPDQLVVHSPKATNNDIQLLFGTTLYDLKVAEMPAATALLLKDGLRLFTPAAALVRVPESFFQLYPIESQVVMASLGDVSDVLRLLLNGGQSAKAGYRAKAFRHTGRDALAARGYWQAFQLVKKGVEKVIAGENAPALARTVHNDWYRELFQPCVTAGLMEAGVLAGYRNIPVYLRGSRYIPPRWEAVRDAMPAFFDLLEKEPEPSVRAVLGHWLFGYIHPYPDGNGRMARFLMNVMLASGGYPWTVIRIRDRRSYLGALDRASIDVELGPFTTLLAQRVRWALEKHDLRFPEQTAKFDFDREVVVFFGE